MQARIGSGKSFYELASCKHVAALISTQFFACGLLFTAVNSPTSKTSSNGVYCPNALFRPTLYRVTVGRRPSRFLSQSMLCLQRPIRLAQQLAPDEDQIGVAARDDFI